MRLIDAHSLWSEIMMLPHNGDVIYSDEVEQTIADAPTVDSVPVVHGKWVRSVADFHYCSQCCRSELMSPYFLKKYCPFCGATMDLED